MSQGAVVIADDDGLAVLAAINAALARFNTTASGNTRPSDAAAGTFWVDTNTPSATVWTVYFYDGTSDISLGTIDSTAHTWSPSGVGPRSYLAGLTLSAAGSTATFGVAAGQATDGGNTETITLASAYTKTTSSWAVGSGNGALDTGAIATSTWYHAWLIKRTDTGVVDVLVSLSASAPTMPASYTLKRRIGSMKTDGSSQWVKFVQDGDLFQWAAPVVDVSATNPGTSAVSRTLTVPTGVNVLAEVQADTNSGGGGFADLYLSDLATDDIAPTTTAMDNSRTTFAGVRLAVRTNTSAQIRSRIGFSDGSTVLTINTLAWRDRRGRDA